MRSQAMPWSAKKMKVFSVFLCTALSAAMRPTIPKTPQPCSISPEELKVIKAIFPSVRKDELPDSSIGLEPSLPKDMWVVILNKLDMVNLLQASRACKLYYALAFKHFPRRLINMTTILLMLYGSDIKMDRAMLDMAWKYRDRLTVRQFQSYAWGLPMRLLPGLQDELDRFHQDLLPTFLDYIPLNALNSPCLSFIEDGVISEKRFWYPTSGERLFDTFNIDTLLIPAHLARRPQAWYDYFAPAFISQYILETWHSPDSLSDYDRECIGKFLVYIQDYVQTYLQKTVFALFIAFGITGYKRRKLTKDIEAFCQNLGIYFPLHAWRPSDLTRSQENCTMPMRSILKIARHWGIDLDLIIEKANKNDPFVRHCIENHIQISTQFDTSVKGVLSAMLPGHLANISTQVIALYLDPEEITNNTGKKVLLDRLIGTDRPLHDPYTEASLYFHARSNNPQFYLPDMGIPLGLGGRVGIVGMNQPPFARIPLEEFIGEPVEYKPTDSAVVIEGPENQAGFPFRSTGLLENYRGHNRLPTFSQRILWKGAEFQASRNKRSSEGDAENPPTEKRRRTNVQQEEEPQGGEETDRF